MIKKLFPYLLILFLLHYPKAYGMWNDRIEEKENAHVTKKPKHETLQKSKILVVDDSEFFCMLLLNQLSQIPALKDRYEVIIARNGTEALKAIEKTHFQLIFMDNQMPKMTGVETTKEIRKTHGKALLPIIAFSADDEKSTKESFLNAGANAFYPKPSGIDSLSKIISEFF